MAKDFDAFMAEFAKPIPRERQEEQLVEEAETWWDELAPVQRAVVHAWMLYRLEVMSKEPRHG